MSASAPKPRQPTTEDEARPAVSISEANSFCPAEKGDSGSLKSRLTDVRRAPPGVFPDISCWHARSEVRQAEPRSRNMLIAVGQDTRVDEEVAEVIAARPFVPKWPGQAINTRPHAQTREVDPEDCVALDVHDSMADDHVGRVRSFRLFSPPRQVAGHLLDNAL